MKDFLSVAESATRTGGSVLIQWKGKVAAREKGPRDLVTEADLASQQEIQRVIQAYFPEHDFLGEESIPGERRSEYRWIVDPLDGTMNYVHQLRSYAVSVALEHKGQVIAGVVYDPELDECYTAATGTGAWRNGERISPSECRVLEQALVAASLPPRPERNSPEVRRFLEVIHACRGLRRLGSAALNLCYVAQGSLDAYWATSVKIWDIAAGMLILQEAGGVMTSLSGGAIDFDRPYFAAAATPALHQDLLTVLGRVPD
jgi:myo-inositol-1(or 4)-monophosphatase